MIFVITFIKFPKVNNSYIHHMQNHAMIVLLNTVDSFAIDLLAIRRIDSVLRSTNSKV